MSARVRHCSSVLRIIRWTESRCMVVCIVLHHFCVRKWLRWNVQLVPFTSVVATAIETFLFNLFTAFSRDRGHISHHWNSSLSKPIQCGMYACCSLPRIQFNKSFVHSQLITYFGIYVMTVFVSIIAALVVEVPALKIDELLSRSLLKSDSSNKHNSIQDLCGTKLSSSIVLTNWTIFRTSLINWTYDKYKALYKEINVFRVFNKNNEFLKKNYLNLDFRWGTLFYFSYFWFTYSISKS